VNLQDARKKFRKKPVQEKAPIPSSPETTILEPLPGATISFSNLSLHRLLILEKT
jgi:hypothetical protein